MEKLHGAGVALITPFDTDGSVDFDSLARLIDYQVKEGMDYLVSLGTTGETATLSKEEKKKIWEFTATRVNNRVPLVAGIGGNNTAEIMKDISEFDIAGYSAILSVSPYYNKPSQEGVYHHYKAIAQASKLPIILYNVPGRTGSNMTAETTVRLAREFDHVVATKDASGSFTQFSEILRDRPQDFLLISGDDPVTLPMMSLGAAGIISVVGNAYPKKVATLTALCADNDYKAARAIHSELLYITELCFVEGNPCGIKYILKQQGIIDSDFVRLPLVSVSDKTKRLIEEEMSKLK